MIKTDAAEISDFLDQLQAEPWLTQSRSWWPKYLFHFTDIQNAARVLTSGKFLSRSSLQQNRQLPIDIADPEVISHTHPSVFDNVRLYFRPLTNMQWNIEGFAPSRTRKHCPVPIVFLIDSKSVLSMESTKFSDGNLGATGPNVGSDANFFNRLPFKDIYHDSSFYGLEPAQKNKIKYHRHAEVIIPNELSVAHVKNIWCRSSAEYQTFIRMLPENILNHWIKKIGVGPQYKLFHRHWNFVEEATLNAEFASFTFHLHSTPASRGPFNVRIEFRSLLNLSENIFIWENTALNLIDVLRIPVSNIPFKDFYRATMTIDGNVAFIGDHNEFAGLF